jgi:hypothetical protein
MAVPPDWSVTFGLAQHTGLANSASDIRAICPHCRTASTFDVRSQFYLPIHGANAVQSHIVAECNYALCRKVVYFCTALIRGQVGLTRDHPFFVYPSREVDAPHPGVPAAISEDWSEAQKAVQASAPKAAAVMFRRVLYGILIDKGCKLNPLREGMAQLIQTQRLPAIFDEWLPAIRDDGHDAAHPDRALQVSSENVGETMEYTSELLRFLYIEPYEFQQRKVRNAAPAAPKAAGKP